MPKINRAFYLDITPEQFVQACSPMEREELRLILDSPRYRDQKGREERIHNMMETYRNDQLNFKNP
jgi:hypothetical protein